MATKSKAVGPIAHVPGSREAYDVTGSDGRTKYRVAYCGSGDGDPDYVATWSCTCPAYEHRGGKPCKHINAVIAMVDAEADQD